ncbi:MAG: YczE/YyaS/YitT family protein [Bacillota bacterium]
MLKQVGKVFRQDYWARILILLFGVFLISLGIFLFINAQMGSDPITVLIDGVATTLNLSFGQATILINTGIVFLLLLLTGKKFGVGTVLNAIFVGVFLDLLFLFFGSITPDFILYRYLMLIAAVISLGSGIAIYVSANMGEGPIEALMLLLKDETNFSLKSVKISMDLCFGAVGFLLGATFGVGTLIGAVAVGPVTQTVFNVVDHYKLK